MAFKIYYLDDEVDLVNLFKAFVVGEKIEVSTFTDASEAIACCQLTPPDLMFIDYRLTDTTGDRVAAVLDKNIKKILLTGELDMAEDPLFELIIKKPFSLSCLKKIIDERLEQANINSASGKD
jgi:DNA-binding NtrC family response regulator